VTDVPPPPPPPPPSEDWNRPPGAGNPDAGAALSYGWNKFQSYAGPVLAIILIPIAAQLILNLLGAAVIRNTFGYILFGLLGVIVSLVGALGIFNAGLMITAGETPDIGKAFSTDRWGEWFAFAIVFGLFVAVGAIFCGVGALIVLAFFGLAPYFFLDQRKSLGEAFSASLEATRSMSGLPLAIALTAFVGVLGVILCYIGVFITLPVAYIGVAFLYRRATNQPVAP
jgi:hypothetical protein